MAPLMCPLRAFLTLTLQLCLVLEAPLVCFSPWAPIRWQLKLQFANKAEFEAANADGKKAWWLRTAMREFGWCVSGPVNVQCVFSSAFLLSFRFAVIHTMCQYIRNHFNGE